MINYTLNIEENPINYTLEIKNEVIEFSVNPTIVQIGGGAQLDEYIKEVDADLKYQLKGDYALKSEIPAASNLSEYQKITDADLKYAVKNHTHDYSELSGLPTLFSGNYSDLTNKPTIPSLAGYATETWATGQFQPKGNYLTSVTWDDVSGKPTSFAPSAHTHTATDVNGLATVATSGSYNDLSDKPTIPSAQVNSDWNATSGAAQILNKPTLFSGNYADLTGKPTLFDGTWNSLSGRPSTFTPSTHTHTIAQVTNLQTTLNGKAASTHTHIISDITGLQTELNGKSASTHTHDSIIQTNGNTALQFWKGTQAQYDGIVTKDSNTVYFIS